MLDETETLDAFFSFLSQIELPALQDEMIEPSLTPLGISHKDELFHLCSEELLVQNEDSPATTPVEGGSTEGDDSNTVSSQHSKQQASKQADKKHSKRTQRISQKQQIESLRETIQDLHAELHSLLSPCQPEESNGQLVPRRKSMWEEIAARQRERRDKSEEENARLRDMVHIQVQEARNLRRVLKRRMKIERMEDMLGVKRQKALKRGVTEDNPRVFEDMLQDIDELYVGVDSLFAQKGLYELPCPGRRSEPRRNVSNGLFLELMQRYMMPFDLQTTEKAVWKAMHQISFEGLTSVQSISPRIQLCAHHIEESNNTLRTSFFVETSNQGNVRGALLRSVVRKYVEKDRVVFICKNLMEPILHDKGKSSSFHTRTTLRIVVQEKASMPEVSLIDSHFSATRYDQGLPASRDIRTSANLDIGISVWEEAISRITHHVENLAIDVTCEKRSVHTNSVD